MSKKAFGTTSKGVEASLYEISNGGGLRVLLTDYGASVVSIFVKDRDGNERDVILGYDNVKSYDNENSLHSGSNGFSKRFWAVKEQKADEITFEIEDADLEQGFPGNAVVDVTFKVTEENALAIIYNAKADKTTTFNMTNHSYFNLNGHASGSVYTHTLQINAEHYTPVKDSKAIPTGEIAPVEGTPFDFTEAKPIGRDIEANDTQLHYGSGYDHNFAIDKTAPGVEKVATAYSPESGIQMEVYTDCVGIQLYTANFIVGQEGKGGVKYNNRDAFCLETQFYPNSINETNFSTPVTKAGDAYHTETDYKFSVK